MLDPFGRHITYLRVSVTDRCDLRCVYCMSENMTFLPKADLLTLEELEQICTAFIELGIEKIRITGGEPLVRKNVLHLFQGLGRHLKGPGDTSPGLQEITVTTNATQLGRHAQALFDAGVRRVNVSLDTLNPDRFRQISRWGDLAQVIRSLEVATAVGLKIKINTVALRTVNDDEVLDLVDWCTQRGYDLTFIETMPMGAIDERRVDQYLPLSDVRQTIETRHTLIDQPDVTTGGPARYALCPDSGRRIGFITPMSHTFCESCNRVRLTCTGRLYMCLGQDDHVDLRAVVRAHPGQTAPLIDAIERAIAAKPERHDFVINEQTTAPAVARHMSVTGG